jgi:hypothetical protein
MSNILFLFEGAVRESQYYKVIEKSLEGKIKSKVNFYCYKTNIHVLYEEINKDTSLDILDLVKEKAKNQGETEELEMLCNTKFGEIYLIFDLDPQDDRYDENKIQEMLKLFDNETEYGKLYINYPMVESFKHFKTIPDPNYNEYKITIQGCSTYKNDVAKLSCINDYRKINKEQYFNILNQNLEKANLLINDLKQCDFETYRNSITQNNVYDFQKNEINQNGELYILNSFSLWPLDYFSKEFFDSVVIN